MAGKYFSLAGVEQLKELEHLRIQTNTTPLMIATVLNKPDVVARLLKLGENPNEINAHDETALHLAYQEQNPTIMEMLIKKGADLKAVSYTGLVVYDEMRSADKAPWSDPKAATHLRILANKYTPKPLLEKQRAAIDEKKQQNNLRLVEGITPAEMARDPKSTQVAAFFISFKPKSSEEQDVLNAKLLKQAVFNKIEEYIAQKEGAQKGALNPVALKQTAVGGR